MRLLKVYGLPIIVAVVLSLLAWPTPISAYFSPTWLPTTLRYGQILSSTPSFGSGYGAMSGIGSSGITGGGWGSSAGGGSSFGLGSGGPGSWNGGGSASGFTPTGGGTWGGGPGGSGWGGTGGGGTWGGFNQQPIVPAQPGSLSPVNPLSTATTPVFTQPQTINTIAQTTTGLSVPTPVSVQLNSLQGGTTLPLKVYPTPPRPVSPPPLTRNYVDLDCMGVYAPTDPHNFAVVNSFFRGGIYTGAVTQTAANVQTITTPVVQPYYRPAPPAGTVDLNSINYNPVVANNNILISSPFVTIYGPNGELLSGNREASSLARIALGLTIPQTNTPIPPLLAQAATRPALLPPPPVLPFSRAGLTAPRFAPPPVPFFPPPGFRPAPPPGLFLPPFMPFGFPGLI